MASQAILACGLKDLVQVKFENYYPVVDKKFIHCEKFSNLNERVHDRYNRVLPQVLDAVLKLQQAIKYHANLLNTPEFAERAFSIHVRLLGVINAFPRRVNEDSNISTICTILNKTLHFICKSKTSEESKPVKSRKTLSEAQASYIKLFGNLGREATLTALRKSGGTPLLGSFEDAVNNDESPCAIEFIRTIHGLVGTDATAELLKDVTYTLASKLYDAFQENRIEPFIALKELQDKKLLAIKTANVILLDVLNEESLHKEKGAPNVIKFIRTVHQSMGTEYAAQFIRQPGVDIANELDEALKEKSLEPFIALQEFVDAQLLDSDTLIEILTALFDGISSIFGKMIKYDASKALHLIHEIIGHEKFNKLVPTLCLDSYLCSAIERGRKESLQALRSLLNYDTFYDLFTKQECDEFDPLYKAFAVAHNDSRVDFPSILQQWLGSKRLMQLLQHKSAILREMIKNNNVKLLSKMALLFGNQPFMELFASVNYSDDKSCLAQIIEQGIDLNSIFLER